MSKIDSQVSEEDVKKAVQGLLAQANMYSVSHLQDPMVQHEFREEYRFLGKCLLRDYRTGIYVGDKVINFVWQERQSLIDQATELGKYGVGIIAGIGQLTTGYGLCVTSSVFSFAGASWCSTVGTPMMAHGGSNIYENSYKMTGNIVENWRGNHIGNYRNHTSWLRDGYRHAARSSGMEDRDADSVYAAVDLATSAYGLKTVLRTPPNANVPGAKQFKLFSYTEIDFLKGWRKMSPPSLLNEVTANTITAYDAVKAYFPDDQTDEE
ncbi:DUF4225 domain-containing protein [Vibrio coralliilyticus]|uniref:DUF4225 domain-containing protein n=1 Tax=Vibrio coralliilyticus TaxID=190893 RepID=UPI00155FA353|nr:DUF4225 domain-containing protein [Vibrio coralliilyticus]NRF26857.1 DUF4225 domain-containing protein [Vibrio coralliilyticus]NRF81116.1 DUF4225 domain-containing protein [Vibrio coralliilyticus]